MIGAALLLIAVCGLFIVIGVYVTIAVSQYLWGVLATIAGVFLFVSGIHNFIMTCRKSKLDRIALKQGNPMPNCTIVDYGNDTSITVNNSPILLIICKNEDTGNTYELNTGQTHEWKYPIGASITLYELDGYITYDKHSTRRK